MGSGDIEKAREIAGTVREAARELNSLVRHAVDSGVHVEIEVEEMSRMAQVARFPFVTVKTRIDV